MSQKINASLCATITALLAMTAYAAEYTWTGTGTAGSWSDTANWSPAGTPGAGDKAVFALSQDLEISTPVSISEGLLSIDITGANVKLSGVVSGEGGLLKTGDKDLLLMSENTYAGGTIVSNGFIEIRNMKALGTSSTPVHLASDGSNTSFGRLKVCAAGTFEYPVHVDMNTAAGGVPGNANLFISNATSTVTLTGAITGANGGVLALRSVSDLEINAPIDIPDGKILNYAAHKYYHYRQSVKVARMDMENNTNGGVGNIYWYSSENEIQFFRSNYKNNFAKTKNAFGTNTICCFGYFEGGRSMYYLQNHDITIDRFDCSYGDKPAPTRYAGHRVLGGTGKGSRITMRATANAVCGAFFEENITLVWDPIDDYTFSTFDNGGKGYGRAPTMIGGIVVSNGTFIVNGTNAFPNVTSLEVAPGATFEWNSASRWANGGLASVTDVSIGSGATISMGEGSVWPFLNFDVLDIASDSTFHIPSGITLSVAELRIDGIAQQLKQFTGADNENPGTAEKLACFTGNGVISCLGGGSSNTAIWTGAGAGNDIATPANWKNGTLPDFSGKNPSQAEFSEPTDGVDTETVSVSQPVIFAGLVFNGTCDTALIANGNNASITTLHDGITCAAGEEEERNYSMHLPLTFGFNQTWTVEEGVTLNLFGPLGSDMDGLTVEKTGTGDLVLSATNSTSTTELVVNKGHVQINGDNAFGGTGGKLYLKNGSTVIFNGGEYDADLHTALGTPSPSPMIFSQNTTNIFNGSVNLQDGHRVTFGKNSLTEFNATTEIGTWTYLNGNGASSVLRFNAPMTFFGGQYDNITFDFRAPNNVFGSSGTAIKYGSNIRILLNCEYAFNTTRFFLIWAKTTVIDMCGHTNKIGAMELRDTTSYITNSGDKAVLWVEQNMGTQTAADQSLYPIVQHGDLCGPVTLGKRGGYPIVFTNRAVSSTGDIIVNAGKVAFCPNSSWLGAQTIVVSNNYATANANLEIRSPETLSMNASIYLEEGATMTLGTQEDASFEQPVSFFYIDGVRQRLGKYSADDGSGNPVVSGTIACPSLSGPGVLLVEGDRRPTIIIVK